MNELLYAAIGFLFARSFYIGRLAWYRHNKQELEAALIAASEELEKIEVAKGIREPDWDLNEFLDDDEEWEGYKIQEKKHEA